MPVIFGTMASLACERSVVRIFDGESSKLSTSDSDSNSNRKKRAAGSKKQQTKLEKLKVVHFFIAETKKLKAEGKLYSKVWWKNILQVIGFEDDKLKSYLKIIESLKISPSTLSKKIGNKNKLEAKDALLNIGQEKKDAEDLTIEEIDNIKSLVDMI